MKRPDLPLPSVEDFGLSRDAAYGGELFGGLSLDQAYEKFLEVPESYQEAFMWMFPKAFAYYFPVVDKYLREVTVTDEWDDGCNAWILGCCIDSQFHWTTGAKPPDYVVNEIASLSEFVKNNLDRYSNEEEERARILDRWKIVDQEVALFRHECEQGRGGESA